jgi:putative colanic acid biosynthesis glycosyltransferase
MKLFSVITITYNNIEQLKLTLESTFNQSFNEFEVIVIDGSSQKDTERYLSSINDIRLKFISEKDDGIYDAMNKGLSLATSEYLIFMNSGDYFYSNFVLEEISKVIKSAAVKPQFLYGDAIEESFEGLSRFYKKSRSHKFLWYGMFTHHQSMIYKTAIIKSNNLKFNSNYSIAADYQFTLEFLKNSSTRKQVNYPLCIFKQGGASSSNWWYGMLEHRKIRKNILKFGFLKNNIIFLIQLGIILIRKYLNPLYNFFRFDRESKKC